MNNETPCPTLSARLTREANVYFHAGLECLRIGVVA
jgi:hypothetical protein